MSYNPGILPHLLQVRSITPRQLSARLGIEAAELASELQRKPNPKQTLLNDIAKELALPVFYFFAENLPDLKDVLPDFRSENPVATAKARETVESIQFARGIQRTVKELSSNRLFKKSELKTLRNVNIEKWASQVRSYFDISIQDQVEAKDARIFYNVCRKKIEDKGIFVLHDSFPESDGSGFCLYDQFFPVVVINTKKQTRGRRLFTLIHELAHVALGITGISDPFVNRNSTERRCNRFAASFLMPREFIHELLHGLKPTRDPDLDDVASVARRLKVSQEASVLRLEEVGVYREGSYQKWKSAIHNIGNPDYSEKGGGAGGPPPQEKVKLAKYGFRFATAFDELLQSGLIDELNLYRSTGLKPKYQRSYFDFASSISKNEVKSLELDDE